MEAPSLRVSLALSKPVPADVIPTEPHRHGRTPLLDSSLTGTRSLDSEFRRAWRLVFRLTHRLSPTATGALRIILGQPWSFSPLPGAID